MYIYLYVCMHVHVYAYMHGCIYMCMCMCMCVCVYIYVYVCVYIYMYLYITCMWSLFHWALGNEDGGVQLVYESACCLAFDRRKDSGVVCVFFIFNAGGSVCVCGCVYTHTHTHTAQVLGCEPSSRDETPGGPEEYRWTKSWHTYIRICVQSTHVYIYVERRDEILD